MQELNPITYGHYRRLDSRILQEERTLLVRLPKDYGDQDTRYPVLYQLDAEEGIFLQTAMTVWYLAEMGKRIPDYIVVGIANTDRSRDMAVERGADNFLRFIQQELVPFVEENYQVSSFRLLCGQSSSALLACYTLLKQPGLFSAHILSSFGLSIQGLERFKAALLSQSKSDGAPKSRLFVTNARQDPYDPNGARAKNAIEFIKALEQTNARVLVHYQIYEDEGHVPYPSLYDGLKWIHDQQT